MLITTVMFIKAFLVALFVSPVLCATIPLQPGRNETVRIFGGVDAQQDDFPYIVSIQDKRMVTDAVALCWTLRPSLPLATALKHGNCRKPESELAV